MILYILKVGTGTFFFLFHWEYCLSVQRHRVNTNYSSIDNAPPEMEVHYKGNDQDVLCVLAAIAISDSPSQSDYELVANFYGLSKDLMEAK